MLFLFSLHHPLCWLFLFGCELCVSFPGGVNIWICALNTKSRIKSRIHFHFIMYAFKSFVVKNETRFASFLMCLFVDFFPPLLWLKYTIIMFQSVRKSNRNMRYAFQTRTFALFETMVRTFFFVPEVLAVITIIFPFCWAVKRIYTLSFFIQSAMKMWMYHPSFFSVIY